MKIIPSLFMAAISVLVTSCGGGGSSSVGIAPNIDLQFNPSNMKAVTATALKATVGSTYDYFNPAWLANTIANALDNGTTSKNCVNGGTIDFINLDPLNSLDSGSVVYNNCVGLPDLPSVPNLPKLTSTTNKTFNGTLYLSNLSVPGPKAADSMSTTVHFNNLKITGTGIDVSLSGGYNHLSLLNTPTGITTEALSGAITNLVITSGGKADVLSGFGFQTTSFVGSTSNNPHSLRFASTALGGAFDYATQNPFMTTSTSRYPNAGIVILSAGISKLRITIQSDEKTLVDNVKAELDSGIGYGTPVYYTWANDIDP